MRAGLFLLFPALLWLAAIACTPHPKGKTDAEEAGSEAGLAEAGDAQTTSASVDAAAAGAQFGHGVRACPCQFGRLRRKKGALAAQPGDIPRNIAQASSYASKAPTATQRKPAELTTF